MRLVRFELDGLVKAGFLLDDEIQEISGSTSFVDILASSGPPNAKDMRRVGRHPVGQVRLLPPVAAPSKIICVGVNYEAHAGEAEVDAPKEPVIFAKYASALIGAHDEIRLPEVAPKRVDYEAELAVVIGARARSVRADQAMRVIAGYTVANDVTARDWQLKKPSAQWLLGKSFDTFLPLGPALVTSDEVPDPHALRIRCRVSGELLQDDSTGSMIFRIPELIAYVSQVFTLEPGDVLLTGTPAGVGMARTPPRWLRPGDLVETSVDGVGTLRNPVTDTGV